MKVLLICLSINFQHFKRKCSNERPQTFKKTYPLIFSNFFKPTHFERVRHQASPDKGRSDDVTIHDVQLREVIASFKALGTPPELLDVSELRWEDAGDVVGQDTSSGHVRSGRANQRAGSWRRGAIWRWYFLRKLQKTFVHDAHAVSVA